MEAKRVLLKVRHAGSGPLQSLGLSGVELVPLFAQAGESGMAASERATHWYLAHSKTDLGDSPWDGAHAQIGAAEMGLAAAGSEILFAEPDIHQSWAPATGGTALSAAGDARPQDTLDVPPGPFAHWHLDGDFAELKNAREQAANGRGVVIAHLDTGYDPDHVTRPRNLLVARERSFIDGEVDAQDRTPAGSFMGFRGHGTATLAILAGDRLPASSTGQHAGDFLGGAPEASILPLRVANSVAQFWSSAVARAIDYARESGAHVLSMSMGGVASHAWADAVNRAYDAGVVMVTAAGNNFAAIPTRFIVYPARFGRVIAACGVMANHRPYFGLPIGRMQGNFGPPGKMTTAIAAYTPNVSWARIGSGDLVDLDGEGTSAATPQIAAAAALYIAKHRRELDALSGWRRVEAVRNALFAGAAKPPRMSAQESEAMLGRGMLRAAAALSQPVRVGDDDRRPPDSASFAFLRGVFGLGVTANDARLAMLALEMTQLAQSSRALEQAVDDPDAEPGRVTEPQKRRFLEAMLEEPSVSRALRNFLEGRIVRRPAPSSTSKAGVPPPRSSQGAEPTPPRRSSEIVPPARRLRIFAIDPSLGTRLDTAFLNETTVDVPWERNASHANLLLPGPVGEYLEVVDVDPASRAAYEPVDLNDPALLAQDGLPPSEGVPQFHQQMVYAVAMRTIRNFESALGRVALWAPRYMKEPRRDIYVPRLRIYPHALREPNAYYSPARRALLFGYFPTAEVTAGGATVFTCLSHDIIAHETTHALLDGIHPRLREASNPDVLAFHEAFADIVAIFQHFTFPEILRHEIVRAQGDVALATRLADLARQFGEALGRSRALRSAIDVDGKLTWTDEITAPHDRGAVLVAAVFDAFIAIYRRRTADLFAATRGRFSPELTDRLVGEAVKTARHVLTICVRALDYLPPVDVTFSDYLRALITADYDLVPADRYGYRVAFLEAFRGRGIPIEGVRTYSVESAVWKGPRTQPPGLDAVVAEMDLSWDLGADRVRAWQYMRSNAVKLHNWLTTSLTAETAWHLGIERDRPIEVHSVRPARRIGQDRTLSTDIVVVITQRRRDVGFAFRGGSTLLIDARRGSERVRYAIVKDVRSASRLQRARAYRDGVRSHSLAALYFGEDGGAGNAKGRALREPFALTHLGY